LYLTDFAVPYLALHRLRADEFELELLEEFELELLDEFELELLEEFELEFPADAGPATPAATTRALAPTDAYVRQRLARVPDVFASTIADLRFACWLRSADGLPLDVETDVSAA
jgi:hypothetical protein